MHALATTMSPTVDRVAALLQDQVFQLHGVPSEFIHGRGLQFQFKFVVNFYRLLGVENNPSMAYHPQMDGQTACVNQGLE